MPSNKDRRYLSDSVQAEQKTMNLVQFLSCQRLADGQVRLERKRNSAEVTSRWALLYLILQWR